MPGAPALNRTESFQYPAAHLGHLNPAQAEALEAFRKLCLEGGYYKPAGTDGPYASHDDETLLFVYSVVLFRTTRLTDTVDIFERVDLFQVKHTNNFPQPKSGGKRTTSSSCTRPLTSMSMNSVENFIPSGWGLPIGDQFLCICLRLRISTPKVWPHMRRKLQKPPSPTRCLPRCYVSSHFTRALRAS